MWILRCYTLHTEVYILFCDGISISETCRFDPSFFEFYFFFMKQSLPVSFQSVGEYTRATLSYLCGHLSFMYEYCFPHDVWSWINRYSYEICVCWLTLPNRISTLSEKRKGTHSISSHVTEVRLWSLSKTLSGKKMRKGFVVVECYQLTMHGHCVFSSP